VNLSFYPYWERRISKRRNSLFQYSPFDTISRRAKSLRVTIVFIELIEYWQRQPKASCHPECRPQEGVSKGAGLNSFFQYSPFDTISRNAKSLRMTIAFAISTLVVVKKTKPQLSSWGPTVGRCIEGCKAGTLFFNTHPLIHPDKKPGCIKGCRTKIFNF
jgi:hypothetical protein